MNGATPAGSKHFERRRQPAQSTLSSIWHMGKVEAVFTSACAAGVHHGAHPLAAPCGRGCRSATVVHTSTAGQSQLTSTTAIRQAHQWWASQLAHASTRPQAELRSHCSHDDHRCTHPCLQPGYCVFQQIITMVMVTMVEHDPSEHAYGMQASFQGLDVSFALTWTTLAAGTMLSSLLHRAVSTAALRRLGWTHICGMCWHCRAAQAHFSSGSVDESMEGARRQMHAVASAAQSARTGCIEAGQHNA